MSFRSNERISVLIDGSNTYAAVKSLGFDIDYKRLREVMANKGKLVRIIYFTAIWRDENGHEHIRPLVDWLLLNGYRVVTKEAKEYTNDGEKVIKGNMDGEIIIHALRQADVSDHIYLFTGDGDFKVLVEELQNKGKTVTVVSTLATRPQMCADTLRKQTDHFLDLTALRPLVEKIREPRNLLLPT